MPSINCPLASERPPESPDPGYLKDFGGRLFMCNAHGRPVQYTPELHEIEQIVRQRLARDGLFDLYVPRDDELRWQCIARIARVLHAASTEGSLNLDTYELAEQVSTELLQWQSAPSLAMDIAAMRSTIRLLCETAVMGAVRLWVRHAQPQPRFNVGDSVRFAITMARRTAGLVTHVDAVFAQYRVLPLSGAQYLPRGEIVVPFELVHGAEAADPAGGAHQHRRP